MKNFIAISSLLLLLCGCAVPFSISTHSFTHYGSDSLRDDSDFFYVKYGVSGSASARYNYSGGGFVRSGLIADAKAAMLQQHNLGPNQTYINLSIDIIRTENGESSYKQTLINYVTITVVVSADIIEYGTATKGHFTNQTKTVGSLDEIQTLSIKTDSDLPVSKNWDDSSDAEILSSETVFNVGDKVIYTKDGAAWDAIIIRVNESTSTYGVEYENQQGKTKRRSAKLSELKLK